MTRATAYETEARMKYRKQVQCSVFALLRFYRKDIWFNKAVFIQLTTCETLFYGRETKKMHLKNTIRLLTLQIYFSFCFQHSHIAGHTRTFCWHFQYNINDGIMVFTNYFKVDFYSLVPNRVSCTIFCTIVHIIALVIW